MNILNFETGEYAQTDSANTDFSQLQWIDVVRDNVLELGGLDEVLHLKHRDDVLNSMHPPFFEQTEDYELLIFRAVDERFEVSEVKTRAIAFLVFKNTVISLRDEDDQSLSRLHERWRSRKQKMPSSVLSLLHSILDQIGNAYLKLREPLYNQVLNWQQRLLDPHDPFNDWQSILTAKTSLRSLNTNLELQVDSLLSWRENTSYPLEGSHAIKFNDLLEHLRRVERLSDGVRSDLDSLIQVYFTSAGQQTNTNVQFLAVISAIFLPLNLIAGFFGMNFETLPIIKHPLGPFITLGLMVALSLLLLWWFKKNKWY